MVTTSKVAERKSRSRNRSRAREMRRAPSIENEFWKEVRDRKLDGFKFKRQVLMGPFIADFVCMEKNWSSNWMAHCMTKLMTRDAIS